MKKRTSNNGPKLSVAERIKKLDEQKKRLELRQQIDELRKQLKTK